MISYWNKVIRVLINIYWSTVIYPHVSVLKLYY